MQKKAARPLGYAAVALALSGCCEDDPEPPKPQPSEPAQPPKPAAPLVLDTICPNGGSPRGDLAVPAWRQDKTACIPARGSKSPDATIAAIDDAVARRLQESGIPGLVLAISKDGRLVHAKGYGYSDLEAQRFTSPTDLFRIASVSKTIGGTAVLRLIQDGAIVPRTGKPLTLDTKVFGDIFAYTAPDHTPNLGDVTVRALLEHRSGLTNDFEWLAASRNFIAKEAEMKAASFTETGVGEYRYKNSHYHLVGEIVKALTGLRIDSYVQDTFFGPNEINRVRISNETGVEHDGAFETRYFRPVSAQEPTPSIAPWNETDWAIDSSVRYAASSFAASPVDLLRWSATLDGSRPELWRSIDDTRKEWITSEASNARSHGLVFDTQTRGSKFDLVHGGYLPGTTQAVLRVRADGISYAFATNSDGLKDLDGDLAKILDEQPLPTHDLSDTYFPK